MDKNNIAILSSFIKDAADSLTKSNTCEDAKHIYLDKKYALVVGWDKISDGWDDVLNIKPIKSAENPALTLTVSIRPIGSGSSACGWDWVKYPGTTALIKKDYDDQFISDLATAELHFKEEYLN